jgi:galactose-1-phosphate uridylyltransferase
MKREADIEKFWKDAELRQAKFKEIVEQIELETGAKIPVRELDRKKIEENVEYVKALTKKIEDRIVAVTEDLFESAKEREMLHVSIRVGCDFHKFLLDFGEKPPRHEAEYVADTIRSGIDWFYSLAFHCHGIRDDLVKWTFDWQATTSFRELRIACLRCFDDLCRPSATAGEMLALLLSYIHLELVFMAQTFPSNVDSNLDEDQWQTNPT